MITKVYGPPGTGKTTKLLEIVKHYIDIDTPLDKIGYFAFTRKAANEAKERMNKPKKDFHLKRRVNIILLLKTLFK